MKNNQQSLSEQKQRRGNLILLVIGIVLLLLFFLALCSMPEKQKKPITTYTPDGGWVIKEIKTGEEEIPEPVHYAPGEGRLLISPDSVFVNSIVGDKGETIIKLQAEKSGIRLESKKLKKEKESPFTLSGSCMEAGNDIIPINSECEILLTWETQSIAQFEDVLLIKWREDTPRETNVYEEKIPLRVNITDSNPCVVCKCNECKENKVVIKREVMTPGGEKLPVEDDKIKVGDKEYPIPDGPVIEPDIKKGIPPIVVEPKYVPLDLKNQLMGTVAENHDVLDFKGEVIGRLLGDKTIVSPEMEVLGKAIPFVPAVKENSEVIGNMVIDEETKSVRIVDEKGKVVGYPRVDSQVVDLEGKPFAFLAPWGLVINFNGDVLGGIFPQKDTTSKTYLLVLNDKAQIVGYMRPMGLAVTKKGAVIGGVVPSGVAVGIGCQSYGTVSMNGRVYDSYKQHIGRVLLDKAVVDNQNNELGSVVRQGVVINSTGKVIGFVNSEGKTLDSKGTMIGCVQPDGAVFAKEKFVGAVMPVGRVISNTELCGQVGSVYPDAQVMSLDLQNLGRVLPDGLAVGEKNKTLGMVTPWGTAIQKDCKLLGLISLNGVVVSSTNGSLVGCITRDKNVQNMKGEIIGMVTPTGIQLNDQNQVIGRIGLDGQIISDKNEIMGCVNSSSAPPSIMPNSTRGVVVDENGYPMAWSFIAGKTYDNMGGWKGDVLFNGWVIGDKGVLSGVVPFSGAVFSDNGEIVAFYNQMSGIVQNSAGVTVGRVLPNMTVINSKGTEILGILIPEKAVFVDMQGNVLGILQADGTLMNQGKIVPGKILANGSLLDENGKLKGARLRIGPVLDGNGKYIGSVNSNANFINSEGILAGRALANGLIVDEQKNVLGMVFPELSTAISVEGWLGSLVPQMVSDGEVKSYQGVVNDIKGNLVGNISAYGNVVGLDETVKGNLVPIAPFVNLKGNMIGWGNFKGEVNGPDGRVIGSILPSGLSLNSAQQIQAAPVSSVAVVGISGEYLGHTTSKGQLLSEKGEVLSIVGFSRFVYDSKGVLQGQLLPPGIALSPEGKVIGWTRYDAQIEDGTKVIGQVGLDGHIFDENGQMIGVYVPLGMSAFSDSNKSFGWTNEKGALQNTHSKLLADVLTFPFASNKANIKGRLISKSPMIVSLNSTKINGVINPDGKVYDLLSRREKGYMMTNTYTLGNSGLLDGAILPIGSAISTTLGVLGQVYPDGSVYNGSKKIASATGMGVVFSLVGELLGGIYTPGVIIDKKGAIVASTGKEGYVMSKGQNVGRKMAFSSALTQTNAWLGNLMPNGAVIDEKANIIGLIEFDGSVLNEEGAFVGRVLPDGSVAGVPQKNVYNTMPYIAHTVAQGLALGLKKEILGRTSNMAQVLDRDNKSVGKVVDSGFILKEGGAPLGGVIPFVTAIAKAGGAFMGTVSPDGKIVSLEGENVGTVAINKTVKGAHELDVIGRLVPEELIVNNCKIIGQPAYDGRVINGQGSVVGRIITDKTAVDAQGNKIGYVPRNGPIMGKEGYLGRSLADGTAVDVNGVEIACVTENGELLNPTTGEIIPDVTVIEPGLILKDGEVVGISTFKGTVLDTTGTEVGVMLPNYTVSGHPDWGYVSQAKEIIFDENGKVKMILEQKGDDKTFVYNDKGEHVFTVENSTIKTPGGQTIPAGFTDRIGIGKIGYFKDCTWFEYETKRSASLMPDGQLLDENGELYGFMSSSGVITAPNGTQIDQVFGYNMDLQECGLSPETEESHDRVIRLGNTSVTLGDDGFIRNENNEIIGTMMDGLLYDLNGQKLDPTAPSGRPRPPKPEPIKIPDEQLEQIQQKMAQKRQSMRQGLGGKPLVMSAEMQARFKPKKDKNWESLGIKRSVSSWPVDMSHVILQGRVIPAVLARSIDSRSGSFDALAIVETNIYAEEGRNILIPAGSQLIGKFSGEENSGANGVAKVAISWQRLIRPDGVAFNLNGSPSGDAMGRSGIAAYLDKQLFQKYGTPALGAVAETVLLHAYQATSPDSNKEISVDSSGGGTMTEAQRTREQVRQIWLDQLELISDELVKEFMQIPPILYVPIGTRLTVMLNQDLWLRSPEDDEEEFKEEYGSQSTEAMRPDVPSWTEKRKQQLKNSDDQGSERSGDTDRRSRNNRENIQNQNKEMMQTPLYDGSDHMDPDLEERVIQPSSDMMNQAY